MLGAILSLSLAITAGCLLQRFSLTRILTAGLAGIALGACSAVRVYEVTPFYFNRLETADVTLSVLIHLAIWCAVERRRVSPSALAAELEKRLQGL